jgi:regulatory protein YycI of two-component signal transduction system YycFG
VCIYDKSVVSKSDIIRKGETYTFNRYDTSHKEIIFIEGYEGVYDFFDERRFLLLKEYRKIKLNKIEKYGMGK